MKKNVAICEDGNGKIHIFAKWIDESNPAGVENFLFEIRGLSASYTILAVFRQDDIKTICSL